MTWNSSPLRLNRRAEISSPSALAQWTEHRKACTETAPRFFCAAVAACFIRTSVGIEPGRFRTLAKMSGSGKLLAPRSHLWPILAGSRELGSNPLDKKRAFLRGDRFGVSIRGDSSRIVAEPGSNGLLQRHRLMSSKKSDCSALGHLSVPIRLRMGASPGSALAYLLRCAAIDRIAWRSHR